MKKVYTASFFLFVATSILRVSLLDQGYPCKSTIPSIESTWKKRAPDMTFSYYLIMGTMLTTY
jgi:hypothetical protein